MPPLFQFLTVLALKIFAEEKVSIQVAGTPFHPTIILYYL